MKCNINREHANGLIKFGTLTISDIGNGGASPYDITSPLAGEIFQYPEVYLAFNSTPLATSKPYYYFYLKVGTFYIAKFPSRGSYLYNGETMAGFTLIRNRWGVSVSEMHNFINTGVSLSAYSSNAPTYGYGLQSLQANTFAAEVRDGGGISLNVDFYYKK